MTLHYKSLVTATMTMLILGLWTTTIQAQERKWYVGVASAHTTLSSSATKEVNSTQNCALTLCTGEQITSEYRSSSTSDSPYVITFGEDGITAENIRLELEFSAANFNVKNASSNRDTVKLKALKVNVLYDFEWNLLDIHPYAGGGLGIGRVEQGDLEKDHLTAHIAAGLSWAFLDRFVLDLGYRTFISEPNLLLEDDDRTIQRDFNGHTWQLGVRYQFGD